MIFFIVCILYLTTNAMENLPSDVYCNYIIPQLIPAEYVAEQPLPRWSEIVKEKNYTKKQCNQFREAYMETYTKKIDDLSSDGWLYNVLPKDLVALALTNNKYYNIILSDVVLSSEAVKRYLNSIENYQKMELCLCLEELGVWNRQNGRIQTGFWSHLNCRTDKTVCTEDCNNKEDSIMIEYFLEYGLNDIKILLAVTLGHGTCLKKNEGLFIENGKEGYDFSCDQFGDFLFDISNRLLEDNYTKKVVKMLAFYIKQQPSLPVKLATYINLGNEENNVHKHRRTKSSLFYSAMDSNEKKAIVGRNDTLTGIRFILLPFSVSSKTKSVLKFIQLLPMYYNWDQENEQTHRINNFSDFIQQKNDKVEGCIVS